MPVAPTYPGVYIEEVPSGVRTITGVATSITAFIGRTLRGPEDVPTIVNGWADFARIFGGLWNGSALPFAVQDFFQNGGGQAVIIRVYRKKGTEEPFASVLHEHLQFKAAGPGSWGNKLEVKITDVPPAIGDQIKDGFGVADSNAFFNVTVTDTATGNVEEFRNLTLVDSPRRIDQVVNAESALVRVVPETPSAPGAPPVLPGTGRPTAVNLVFGGTGTGTVVGSDGDNITKDELNGDAAHDHPKGLLALERVDLFNLLVIPPLALGSPISSDVVSAAVAVCEARRAVFIMDPPKEWTSVAGALAHLGDLPKSSYAALYFPGIRKPNPLRENRLDNFPASGAVAGVIARTDVQRGVWKAPAGQEAVLLGVPELTLKLNDMENGQLNPHGVNCLRSFPATGRVVWGARTLRGEDQLADQWKYLPVRRLALFIEESLYRGTQWVVFEPNDEPLWSQIRLNVGAFMQGLFRQGAFQGTSARDAYFVKCDGQTTTQNDINLGIVNIVVGFAPLKPAEFVIIKIQQLAGQIQT